MIGSRVEVGAHDLRDLLRRCRAGSTASIRRSEPPSGEVGLREAEVEQVAACSCSGRGRASRSRGRRPWRARGRSRRRRRARAPAACPGPSRSRADRVCSTGTKYVCAPALRSRASSSILGRSAARQRSSAGGGAGDGVEPVEERAHRRQRAPVVARRLRVADADAEHEAPGELRAQRGVLRRRLGRVVGPDVEDPRRGGQRRRGLQDRADVGHVRRAADPPRAVAELLHELGRLAGALGAERAVAGPDADRAEIHDAACANRDRRRARGVAARARTPSSALALGLDLRQVVAERPRAAGCAGSPRSGVRSIRQVARAKPSTSTNALPPTTPSRWP